MTAKKKPEIRIDLTEWHPGDWPLMEAVKVETKTDEGLIRIYIDEDEAENVTKKMLQHHFEMLCGVEDSGDDSGFQFTPEGLEFYSPVFSRSIVIPWDRLGAKNAAAIATLEKWIKDEKSKHT